MQGADRAKGREQWERNPSWEEKEETEERGREEKGRHCDRRDWLQLDTLHMSKMVYGKKKHLFSL